MKNNNIFITIKKELRGILRDKKYLSIILLTPLIIPFYVILMGFLEDGMANKNTIGLNYNLNNNELSIINELQSEYETEYIEGKTKEELESLYNDGKINAYIIKEDNTYTIYVDESSTNDIYALSATNAYLSGYNLYLGNNYLVGEDIDPDNVFHVLDIKVNDLAKDGRDYMTTLLLDIVLSYLIMIVSMTAINTSVDLIVGEKERGTLETILTFPIKSNELILGKFFAITLSCIITSALGIILTIPAFAIAKSIFTSYANVNINLGLQTILLTILILILTSLLCAGISIALSGKAKNFKEAQGKVGLLTWLPLISMITGMAGIKTNILLSIIPVANSGILLNDLFFNGANYLNITAMLISTIIYIIVIVKYISLQYKDEKTLF